LDESTSLVPFKENIAMKKLFDSVGRESGEIHALRAGTCPMKREQNTVWEIVLGGVSIRQRESTMNRLKT
jgi:hypothetical protein